MKRLITRIICFRIIKIMQNLDLFFFGKHFQTGYGSFRVIKCMPEQVDNMLVQIFYFFCMIHFCQEIIVNYVSAFIVPVVDMNDK